MIITALRKFTSKQMFSLEEREREKERELVVEHELEIDLLFYIISIQSESALIVQSSLFRRKSQVSHIL